MTPPRFSNSWKICGLAGVVLLVLVPALDAWRHAAEDAAKVLQQKKMQAEQGMQQFRADLASAANAPHELTQDDIDHLLAPVNRAHVMADVERRAASAGLGHFTYALSPAESPAEQDGSGGLAKSRLKIEADAVTDLDAVNFIRTLRFVMPGRVDVQILHLSRTGAELSDANMHMQAELVWLTNGEAP